MEQTDAKKALLAANARKIYDLAFIYCRERDTARLVTERSLKQLAREFDSGERAEYTNARLDSMVRRYAAEFEEAAPTHSRARAAALTFLFVLLLLLFTLALVFAYDLMAEREIIDVSFRFGFLEWFNNNICPVK